MIRFSIVTPSFRSGRWLKLCIPSVADQEGVTFEHIVQDSCSDDETALWLPGDPRVTAFIEKDSGMYDAVNRGFRHAQGELLAYINCDEQYLPGVLRKVSDYFDIHPEVDALIADCIVVDSDGNYKCERKSMIPQLSHTQVGTTLSFLTAALFLRRRVLEKHQLFFDTHWRDLGDVEWTMRAIRAGIRFGVLRQFTTIFTDTGENMNLLPNARREKEELHSKVPWWLRVTAPLWVIHYRLRRLFAGVYRCKPHDYAIYTPDSAGERKLFHVDKPTFRWTR
ncbi:MAG: hypothetical protein JWL59_4027 [Chthoniobacteraceae bacterium]|nr:hypothetical protein [Chthoniobacteraceae bacterium]